MTNQRYWGLCSIAVGMAVHSLVVGKVLGSSFFMLAFFWGWVAAAAWRGHLEAARAMVIPMIALLAATAAAVAFVPALFRDDVAYLAFAPSLVSWICAFFYIRHLQRLEPAGVAARRRII